MSERVYVPTYHKTIDLCDLPALMIASEVSDLIRIPHLQCQQLSEGEVASVNKVSP